MDCSLPGFSIHEILQAKVLEPPRAPRVSPAPAALPARSQPQWRPPGAPMQEMRVPSLHLGDPLEEGMATPSSILAWRIP